MSTSVRVAVRYANNKKFDSYISLAADSLDKLRSSDVYRVLEQARSASEAKSLAAYLVAGNSKLKAVAAEDLEDLKEANGWA